MGTWRCLGILWLTLAVVASGCAARGPAVSEDRRSDAPAASVRKRITAAVVAEPTALRSQLSRSSRGSLPGTQEIEQLVHAGLAIADHQGGKQPQLAEAVPSAENGLWKVFPDGRMETVWKIREGARWHDGTAFTADDLVFTSRVARDSDLLLFRDPAFASVEAVEAPDPRTVIVRWTKPYIEADALFSGLYAVPTLPLPKHILEAPYVDSKETFPDLAFWSSEFIGAGPFRLKEWSQGSHVVLNAFEQYVLGRPKVDEIEVRFILDRGALMANILAGEVDLTIGTALGFEEGLQLRDQWRNGTVEFSPSSGTKLWPQFRNPNPRVVGDVRFRRALLHAIDRQQLADTLTAGQSSVTHSTLAPGEAEFEALQGSVIQYSYDPRRAMELIAELGYVKGADEGWRHTAGQRLAVEVRTVPRDILIKSVLTAADEWKKLGLSVEPIILTQQQRSDREFYATYPAFDAAGSNNGVRDFIAFHSSQLKTTENRFTGSNRSGYVSAELDGLIDRFFTTIPMAERLQVASQIVRHVTDQLVFLPLFYDLSPTVVANRLVEVPRRVGRSSTETWNGHLWDVKGS